MHNGFKNQHTKSVSINVSEGQRKQKKKATAPLSTELVVFSNIIHSLLVNYRLIWSKMVASPYLFEF